MDNSTNILVDKLGKRGVIMLTLTGLALAFAIGLAVFSLANRGKARINGEPLVMGEPIILGAAEDAGARLAQARESLAEPEVYALDEPVYADSARLTEAAKILYEYYYEGDGRSESFEEKIPRFMVGMSREQAAAAFKDWEMLAFDEDKIAVRRHSAGNSGQYYTVGVYNGFVAVFYDTAESKGLMEVTGSSIESLTYDDRERLKTGIKVTGNENLYKILQDYGS